MVLTLIFAIAIQFGVLIGIVLYRKHRSPPRERVCYRCGKILQPDPLQYMGLDYCMICREVVSAMAWMITTPGGPPFGFPGGPGYLKPPEQFRDLEAKKNG